MVHATDSSSDMDGGEGHHLIDHANGAGSHTNGRTNGHAADYTNGANGSNGTYAHGHYSSAANGANSTAGFTPAQSSGRFPRISRPVELLRPSYDVVVIGSGYGGAVAASRMARGGQGVCLLERGKERWPGEYPVSPLTAFPELHVSGDTSQEGRTGIPFDGGDPTGLYHLIVGEGQNAFVANGLGGTSLLNANVFLEADEKVLQLDIWPEELRGQENWKKYYDRARDVLQPEQYPEDYPELDKLTVLQKQAELLGWGERFYRVPQTTRFVDGPNSTGVPMRASTLSGQDTTGVNDGSKSSTLVNYLSDAWNWGAEMFCECEVRHVVKAPDREGYLVYFAWHGARRGKFKDRLYEDLMWVHAKKMVFFGAGSLGTTEILLRSKRMGLPLSNDVGFGLSGNGDILAFGYNTDLECNSVGREDPPAQRPVGPCITGVIDCRDTENVLEGFVIEEGVVPAALAPFYGPMLNVLSEYSIPRGLSPVQFVGHILARMKTRVLGPYASGASTQKTQCYLIMSHDSSQATMTLKDNRPVLNYSGVGRSTRARRLDKVLEAATNRIGGTYVPSPFYAVFGQKEITVHAIGGARVSNDGTAEGGGTNHIGQLFTGNVEDKSEVHDGLIVTDGTVVPAALGVNPFATITALAERAVEKVAEQFGIEIDYETRNGVLDLFGKPQHPVLVDDEEVEKVRDLVNNAKNDHTATIGFSEVMEGWIHMGDGPKDFATATNLARSRCESARFFLSVKSWDTHHLVYNHNHSATLTGTFSCPALGGACMVQRGEFQLFNDDSRTPDTMNLTYNFDMTSPSGELYHFYGYKVVDPSVSVDPLRLWQATTTLYCTITKPDQGNRVIGRGTLYIGVKDFLPELVTMEATGPGVLARVRSAATFLGFFTVKAASAFLAPLGPQQWPGLPYGDVPNPTTPDETFTLEASDKVRSTLHVWHPRGVGPQDPAPVVLMVPGAAVDQQIFALPTIEKNAVQYYRERGYRVYCVVHRVGKTIEALKGYTTYDARLDVCAALEFVRRRQSPGDLLYVIAHCAGSSALACGLLDGTIPASWISGITASNVFMNPIFAWVNHVKASIPLAENLLFKIIGSWFNCSSSHHDSLFQQALNQVLRFYPVGSREEICSSVVCHRSSLMFGRLWSHKGLNRATHAQLENFVGGVSEKCHKHLVAMGLQGFVTDPSQGTDLVTPENVARLHGVPILFIQGADNAVYAPENTDRSFTALATAHGGQWYERQVFEGRGHLDCWMGSTAYKDVYPRVLSHIEKTHAGLERPPRIVAKKAAAKIEGARSKGKIEGF